MRVAENPAAESPYNPDTGGVEVNRTGRQLNFNNCITMSEKSHSSQQVKPPSERSFGIVFTVVFLLIAFYPLIDSQSIRGWALAVALVFAALAVFVPRVLTPLNLAWFRVGLLLHKIVNPLVLGLIYFAVIVPAGFLMRRFRKDPLKLLQDPESTSYWVTRTPPGPSPDSLRHPF